MLGAVRHPYRRSHFTHKTAECYEAGVFEEKLEGLSLLRTLEDTRS